MWRLAIMAALCLALIRASGGGQPAQPAGEPADVPAADRAGVAEDQIQRGHYLVHHVAMCVQCHSPRDDRGRLVTGRLLHGGPVPLQSPYPAQRWAFQAPRIAGLPGWTDEAAVDFLQTGQDPAGWSPLPPMPPFRLDEQDATAVVAYLKSL